tara:strand:- start:1256 stop:1633 length:378 start_codon:yes stop_codon:yes gene_type:complete
MPTPNYHNYTAVSGSALAQYQTGSIATHRTLVEHVDGQPGHYNDALAWSGSESSDTWGAFLISGSAGIEPNATITVAGGAEISINNFADHKLFEIGVTNISGSAPSGGEVYLFKRRREVTAKVRR